ncbi:hypothetical protein HDN1F_09990 [gamma proteobacterium HdN1]|nr:hypothetical protein HDN1F_09990 [gamma proteobacterium HdN1]
MALTLIRRIIHSAQARILLSALASAFTWFAWAWWANHSHGQQAWLSGLSQGGVSFITTSIGSFLLEVLFVRLGHSIYGMAASVALVSGLSLSFMISVHLMAGTPNLILTILPVFTVVLLYCSSYVFSLKKLKTIK